MDWVSVQGTELLTNSCGYLQGWSRRAQSRVRRQSRADYRLWGPGAAPSLGRALSSWYGPRGWETARAWPQTTRGADWNNDTLCNRCMVVRPAFYLFIFIYSTSFGSILFMIALVVISALNADLGKWRYTELFSKPSVISMVAIGMFKYRSAPNSLWPDSSFSSSLILVAKRWKSHHSLHCRLLDDVVMATTLQQIVYVTHRLHRCLEYHKDPV